MILSSFRIAACVAFASIGAAFAQTPYAGFEARSIKALSEQQIADLRAGRGMGLALPAELNGYPGPIHVLELAAPLHLSDRQRVEIERLYASMKTEAIPLGEKIIAQEGDLDALFARKIVTAASLEAATRAIGETQAMLRATHLRYHLTTIAILTPEQSQRYAVLRGYSAGAHGGHQPGRRH
jgi:hypothetical protein